MPSQVRPPFPAVRPGPSYPGNVWAQNFVHHPKGFDPANGARPMAKVISQYIKSPIANDLLDGKIKNGQKIFVSVDSKKDILDIKFSEPKSKKVLKKQ